GRGAKDLWAVGDAGVLRYPGSAWQKVETPASYPLNSVTVTSDGNVWALGEGGMVRYDGKEWVEVGASQEGAPTVLFGGPSGPYVAGSKGVWRFDGKAWASVLSRTEALAGYTAASDEVWALVKGEEVRHWNGVGWRRLVTGSQLQLRAAWSRNGEVVAVGDGGAIVHFRP
ncbi:MAG: hypothetical protein HY901_34955, partial [Deltaproteobacteria bacterium]|nr:hypothetical protein [Deltaproteobacteria bacterium]